MTDEEKMAHDDKIKHLEFIQDAINRMSANSFQMKGWMITTVAASLLATTQNSFFAFGAIFPTICFWGLDSY